MAKSVLKKPDHKAYIVTGPTSGIGRALAYGTVVLAGRDPGRLDQVQKRIEKKGRHAVAVVCDSSETTSVRSAAAEIIARSSLDDSGLR